MSTPAAVADAVAEATAEVTELAVADDADGWVAVALLDVLFGEAPDGLLALGLTACESVVLLAAAPAAGGVAELVGADDADG
ncbi:hypothetical protein [Mycobacterium sp. MAA66]|uniref:hypothetical protein n=1 Tax=Mycobacterium sp. MAA66 TaxID=3156297 RepID=UPI0035187C35